MLVIPNKLKIAHINIKSIRSTLDLLPDQIIKRNFDILMIYETEIAESFQVCQFEISGFNTPCRVDRDLKCGGIMLYIRGDLSAKPLLDWLNEGDLFC